MRITEVDTHEICPPLQAWNTEALTRYQGVGYRYAPFMCSTRTTAWLAWRRTPARGGRGRKGGSNG